MKGTAFVAITVLSAASAFAQAPQTAPSAIDTRQQQVHIMEGVLTVAVRNGAETLARRLQVAEPGSLIVTGTARARGFALDGYGVFFDVDVPQMKQSVAWSTMMLVREARKQQLRQLLASNADPETKRSAALELRRLSGAPDGPPVAAPSSSAGVTPTGTVSAQTLVDAPAPDLDTRDPNEQYTDAIKGALVDAMLNFSGPMNLGADEWLTIAARDSEGPLMPGAVDDASTIVLRVKGSDISEFQSKKISIEEARKRVLIKEF